MGVTEIAGCAGLAVEKCRVSKRLAASIPGTIASRQPMSETTSHLPTSRACPDAAHIIKGGFVGSVAVRSAATNTLKKEGRADSAKPSPIY